MSQHDLEQVELTNMCAVVNPATREVVVQERVKSWRGVTFPGGHVEKGEAIVPSTIREIKEETGLDIDHLQFCGVKDWFEPDKNKRYIVFLFKTSDFSGQLLKETDEGKVFWTPIDRLPAMKLASGFQEMIDIMLHQAYAEFWYDIAPGPEGDWTKRFY